jgi:hypothetical protein
MSCNYVLPHISGSLLYFRDAIFYLAASNMFLVSLCHHALCTIIDVTFLPKFKFVFIPFFSPPSFWGGGQGIYFQIF